MKTHARIYAHRMAAIQAGRRQTIESEEEPVTHWWEGVTNSQILKAARLWTLEEWSQNLGELPYYVNGSTAAKIMPTLSKAANSSSVVEEAYVITDAVGSLQYPGTGERYYSVSSSLGSYTMSVSNRSRWPYTRVS